MRSKYLSRKFILAVIGALLGIVNAFLEANGGPSLPVEQVLAILAPIVAFILGESFVDAHATSKVSYVKYVGSDEEGNGAHD